MSGPVLWGVPPIPTEGLMAHVARTVSRNFLPSSFTLLRQVGVNHANNPTAAFIPDLDEHRLAEILRVPVEEVARRRHFPRPEFGYVDFFGSAVRFDEMVVRTVRFAPAALAASPHSRALWSLKTVPFCTETWQYLTSDCSCGVRQRWQHVNTFDRCHACNRRLALVDTASVPEDQHDSLSFLVGLLDPDLERRATARRQLPADLTQWDGGMVFELALSLMPLTPTGYTPKRRFAPLANDLAIYTRALSDTADMIRCWPTSLVPCLEDAIIERANSKVNVRYVGPDAYLSGLDSSVMPDLVREAIRAALCPVTAKPGENPPNQMGMREAALYTGHVEHALAAGRRAGQLKTRVCLRANRMVPTLDRAEIEYVRDFLNDRVGPDRAAGSLGLPQYAIAMLASAGLLSLEDHPYLVSTYGPNQLHRRELLKFVKLMKNGSVERSLIDRPVPLHRVVRGIGGGLKPWGRIFRELTDGVAYSMSRGSISGITIGMEYADKLRALDLSTTEFLPTGRCSQRDALEILNLPLRHASVLEERGIGTVTEQFAWKGVQAVAHEQITLTEMSARTGIHGTRLESMLEKEGLPRRDSFGWMREEVTDFLSALRM